MIVGCTSSLFTCTLYIIAKQLTSLSVVDWRHRSHCTTVWTRASIRTTPSWRTDWFPAARKDEANVSLDLVSSSHSHMEQQWQCPVHATPQSVAYENIYICVTEWPVDCSDMVEIEARCRIPTWRTFGRIQWHVIRQPPAALQGAAAWRMQCHDPRATCHIAGCCHLVNSLSCSQSLMPHCRV